MIFLAYVPVSSAQSAHVIADGQTDAYTLIDSILALPNANVIETPDCLHPQFGPHITQEFDTALSKSVFVFNMHRDIDGDGAASGGCQRIDRQRLEIKTYENSPDYLKAFLGDTVTYRWRFKLDAGFQVSPAFTHIHQIKAVGGNDDPPVFTLSPVVLSNGSQVFELRFDDIGDNSTTRLQRLPLAPFKGEWLEVREKITYTEPTGPYSIEIRRVSDGAVLLSYSDGALMTWRPGGTRFVRPKWGIYRNIQPANIGFLRDEQVKFDGFCLAKGSIDDCPRLAAAPWATGIAYHIGDLATDQGDTWKVVQAHSSQPDWAPPNVPALWVKVPKNSAWDYPVQYVLGAKVTYQGVIYTALQAHTSLSSWTPTVTPALWSAN
ncbi:MAG TPA: carbohydrate-binding protein [Steroidobacteraceae bacterium]|nr:carbohydrate-binding protein [Steroidobacteraceae bacterium]